MSGRAFRLCSAQFAQYNSSVGIDTVLKKEFKAMDFKSIVGNFIAVKCRFC